MASKSRKAWVALKGQLEKSLGKEFVAKAFKNDLGPSFDKLDSDLDKLVAKATATAKVAKSLEQDKADFVADFMAVRGILDSYGQSITAEAKKKKIDASKVSELDRVLLKPLRQGYASKYLAAVKVIETAADGCGQKGAGVS